MANLTVKICTRPDGMASANIDMPLAIAHSRITVNVVIRCETGAKT